MKKIVLGTAQFSGDYGITRKKNRISKKEVHKILKTLLSKRLNHLDTSYDYKNSFKKIQSFNFRNWQVTTKLNPARLDFSSEKNLYLSIEKQTYKIKKMLSVKIIKNLLIRNSNIFLTKKGRLLFNALKKAKKNKLIKNFGYSIYDYNSLKKIITNYRPDLIQCPYNIIDRRIEDPKIINFLKKRRIKIQVRSIFLQGILLRTKNKLPKFFDKWKKVFLNFEKICEINKLSPLSICLNYVNNNKNIDEILIGVQNEQELKEIFNLKLKRDLSLNKKLLIFKSLNLVDPRRWKNG